MFACRKCLLSSLRALVGDAPSHTLAFPASLLLNNPRTVAVSQRLASTAVAAANHNDYGPLIPGRQTALSNEEIDARASEKAGTAAATAKQKKQLAIEMQYLRDPFKLAQHIRALLERDRVEKALDLVRFASKDTAAVVSWNHIINWYMLRHKFDDAIKIYNEMKKRAVFPDSHTYILLLRGLARPHHHGQPVKESNVAKALNIYNSMSNPNSNVKPDVRHTNAALQVCAAAGDMDAAWGIFSKLSETGPFAPDQTTYTILLDGIRFANTSNIPQGNDLAGITRIRDRAILEGRRVWRAVIQRWRAGEVAIDSQLICSMGRLLLTSPRMEDRDDVFSLVQQTTNIERLALPLDHPDRHTAHIPEEAGAVLPRDEVDQEDTEGFKEQPVTQVFHPIRPYPADSAHPKRPITLAWVAPTSHILSMLMDACTALRIPKTANAYWDLFTKQYGVAPDAVAFNSQLKLLAMNRNSARVAKLIKDDMAAAGLELKNQTFRIAMRACARDNKNPNVLSHARVIVDKMDETQEHHDIHTLVQYLSLAMLTNDATQIVNTLNRLDSIVHKLRSRFTYGTNETGTSPEYHAIEREEIVGLMKTMVGAIDTLMNRGLVDREQYSHWHDRRSGLNTFIGKAINSVERQQQRLDLRDADIAMKKKAKEAGRLMRQQKYEERGQTEPRMSRSEWALKIFRKKNARRSAVEERRERAAGVSKWTIDRARREQIFADSPMELAQR